MLVKLILRTYPLMLALGVIIFTFTPSTANAQTETVQYVQKCRKAYVGAYTAPTHFYLPPQIVCWQEPVVSVNGIDTSYSSNFDTAYYSFGSSLGGGAGEQQDEDIAEVIEVIEVNGVRGEEATVRGDICANNVCDISLALAEEDLNRRIRQAMVDFENSQGSYVPQRCANGRSRREIMQAYIDANVLLGKVKAESGLALLIEITSLKTTLSIAGVSPPVVDNLIKLAAGVNTVALAVIVKQTADRLKQEYNDALETCNSNDGGPWTQEP